MLPSRSEQRLKLASWGLHAAGVGVACLILVVGWCVNTLFNRQISAHETQAEFTQMFLAGSDKIIERQQITRQRFAELKEANDALLARIPELPQEAEFLGLLTRSAAAVDLELNEFRPGPHAARGTYSEFDVQLSGHGTYESACRFLAGLDTLPRLCKLHDLRLTAGDESGEECQVEMRLLVPFALRAQPAAAENKP